MTKQLRISTFILTIFLTSCGQKKNNEMIEITKITENTEITKTQRLNIDTSAIAVIKLDSSTNNTFQLFTTVTNTELTSEDLENIELILLDFLKEYNPKQKKLYNDIKEKDPNAKIDIKHFTIDLRRYKRQYYATTNEKGEKEIWVNCFCDTWDKNWKEDLIFVFDGGNCYFNLKINLKTKKYYNVMVNGDA